MTGYRLPVILGCVLGLAGTARADEANACAYAADSLTMFFASELSPLPTISGRVGVEGGVRLHRDHVAIEARLGVAGAFSATIGGLELGYRAGASIGYAFAVARRVALEPMAGYDVLVLSDETTTVIQRVTVELPVSIVLYPHVVLEPYGQLGLARSHGTSDLVLVVGPRLGVVF